MAPAAGFKMSASELTTDPVSHAGGGTLSHVPPERRVPWGVGGRGAAQQDSRQQRGLSCPAGLVASLSPSASREDKAATLTLPPSIRTASRAASVCCRSGDSPWSVGRRGLQLEVTPLTSVTAPAKTRRALPASEGAAPRILLQKSPKKPSEKPPDPTAMDTLFLPMGRLSPGSSATTPPSQWKLRCPGQNQPWTRR